MIFPLLSGMILRAGVTTHDANGLLIHNDYILADSLTSQLDKFEWMISSPTLMTTYRAPLDEMRGKY